MKRKRNPYAVKSRRQTARALSQRAANARAFREGRPLPYPNPWDAVDPTKVPRDATPEQVHESYREFMKLCRPIPRKKHYL
jgi:hypothetical protein